MNWSGHRRDMPSIEVSSSVNVLSEDKLGQIGAQ